AAERGAPRSGICERLRKISNHRSEFDAFASRCESFEDEINADRELSLAEPDRLGQVSCLPLDRCYPDDAATISRWVPEAPAGGVQKKQVIPSEPLRLAPPIDRERGPPFTQDPTQGLAVRNGKR